VRGLTETCLSIFCMIRSAKITASAMIAFKAGDASHALLFSLRPCALVTICYFAYCIELAAAEKAVLEFDPMSRTVPTTRTRITARITAYSAMSWPSSSVQRCRRSIIGNSFHVWFKDWRCGVEGVGLDADVNHPTNATPSPVV